MAHKLPFKCMMFMGQCQSSVSLGNFKDSFCVKAWNPAFRVKSSAILLIPDFYGCLIQQTYDLV
jgi:hypothetical protein